MGLREKRFWVGSTLYQLKKFKNPTHKWRLFRGYEHTDGFVRWTLVKDGMSKAEAERMYKLLKG